MTLLVSLGSNVPAVPAGVDQLPLAPATTVDCKATDCNGYTCTCRTRQNNVGLQLFTQETTQRVKSSTSVKLRYAQITKRADPEPEWRRIALYT